jgi:hypothetical protein
MNGQQGAGAAGSPADHPILPDEPISIDAFTGAEVASGLVASRYAAWALRPARFEAERKLLPTPPDPAAWADERVGWGLVLPEPAGLDAAALATADDAPEPIRALVAARKGKVLRYRAGTTFANWALRDYAGGGDLFTASSPPGSGPKQLPMYLLIYATPAQIPWSVQYALNPVRHVGRLDLDGDALANYVGGLIAGWPDSRARYDAPVVWSVDHGGGDITTLMREAIGTPVYDRLRADTDITSATYIDGSRMDATGKALGDALRASTPSLVVTTSHGMTGPLDDVEAMRASLGLLVDSGRAPVDPTGLLAGWHPDGAIWFAQACCSVGADSPSAYTGLFEPGSVLARVLDGVAVLGAMTAPLPRALLGASKPLRAFIGHVEPTFNWTMSFPPNRQTLTSHLQTILYERLCSGLPVGLAMSQYYQPVGSLLLQHGRAADDHGSAVGDRARAALDLALYSKVTAYDRASMVVLGDPTVAMPLPRRP